MSRGFVREDDQEEAPFIPPRAPLPEGATNLVTPRGMRLLLEERHAMEAERNAVEGTPDDRRRALAVIQGRLALLNDRIASARVVEPDPTSGEVRFGTTVTFHYITGPQQGVERTFTLVGVDEASAKDGLITVQAPIAQVLLSRRAGDRVEFRNGPQVHTLEILRVG